jgi:hypothetical protein
MNSTEEIQEYRFINFEHVRDGCSVDETVVFIKEVASKTWFACNEEEMHTKFHDKCSNIKLEFEIVEKRYKITHVEFNGVGTSKKDIVASEETYQSLVGDVYLAHNEEELRRYITEETGLCIKNIEYEVSLLGEYLNTVRAGSVVRV